MKIRFESPKGYGGCERKSEEEVVGLRLRMEEEICRRRRGVIIMLRTVQHHVQKQLHESRIQRSHLRAAHGKE